MRQKSIGGKDAHSPSVVKRIMGLLAFAFSARTIMENLQKILNQ